MVSHTRANALVLQSGGPTAVINQTLAGILATARFHSKKIHTVYGAFHGLHGLLYENLLDLSDLPERVLSGLAHTPGAALGSARLKPKREDLDRLFQVFREHHIRYVFYIGGNDSAEAAQLIRSEANQRKHDLHILHVPKTIDNDLMETDHCPGYGSVARVAAHLLLGDDLDNRSFYNGIKINICMGRHAGWIAAASALARRCVENEDYENCGPHLIYMPERKFTEEQFLDDVQKTYDRLGRATVVVAEGIADQLRNSRFAGEKDEFGNAQLSGSGKLGDYLAHSIDKNILVKSHLGKLRVRADTWGYLQRSLPGMVSSVDSEEAFAVGAAAVSAMMAGETDKTVIIKRVSDCPYASTTALVDLEKVAQKTKLVPSHMINTAGNGVTNAFFEYVEPLVGELPKAFSLGVVDKVNKKLGDYVRV
ncbi:MAG: 6-phosphofructokinase [Betaproteobacteria bacterium]|nr:6-phosphofructokinase [Betaproteobacteria bacterium]